MNDNAKLLSDDLESGSVAVIGSRRFYLTRAVVALAALAVGKDHIGRDEFIEGFDGPSAVGM
jgi:hypothetical protein